MPKRAQIKQLIREKLSETQEEVRLLAEDSATLNFLELNPHIDAKRFPQGDALAPAAVLVPLIERAHDLTVLFTRRTDDLATHAGQIAFPGGRVDDSDESLIHAALRETHEEVGIDPSFVDIAGLLDIYTTGSGFRIQPVVGFVQEGFEIIPNPREVAEVFEVPLGFLLDRNNHRLDTKDLGNGPVQFYAVPYEEHYIWGATAGMLLNFVDRVHN